MVTAFSEQNNVDQMYFLNNFPRVNKSSCMWLGHEPAIFLLAYIKNKNQI